MKYAVFFIALLFAGCPITSMAQNLTFECAGLTIEVAENDFPDEMTYDQAKRACAGLGNGWRLPTQNELLAMREQLWKKGKANLTKETYWNSNHDKSGNPWAVQMSDGGVKWGTPGPPDYNYRVRAVRTLP